MKETKKEIAIIIINDEKQFKNILSKFNFDKRENLKEISNLKFQKNILASFKFENCMYNFVFVKRSNVVKTDTIFLIEEKYAYKKNGKIFNSFERILRKDEKHSLRFWLEKTLKKEEELKKREK